jgi:hypothetical protein
LGPNADATTRGSPPRAAAHAHGANADAAGLAHSAGSRERTVVGNGNELSKCCTPRGEASHAEQASTPGGAPDGRNARMLSGWYHALSCIRASTPGTTSDASSTDHHRFTNDTEAKSSRDSKCFKM